MKIFNKYITILAALVLVYACNPLEDEYNELEDQIAEEGSTTVINRTLSSEDYAAIAAIIRANGTVEDSTMADFVGDNEAFSPEIEAKTYLPEFVNDTYPQFGKGTAVKITYSLFNGTSSDYSVYLESPEYELKDADYTSVGLSNGFFFPSASADDNLPAILSSSIQDAESGATYAVSYMMSAEDTLYDYANAGLSILYDETFGTDLSGVTTINITGDNEWYHATYVDGCAVITPTNSSYDGVPEEDWLITPSIDLSGLDNASFQFLQVMNYLDGNPADFIDVFVSTDFDGSDVSAASWTELTVDEWPAGNSWSEEVWSTMDISAFVGSSVNIALVLNTTAVLDGLTWEVGQLRVTTSLEANLISASAEEHVDYYEFDGSAFTKIEGVYTLAASDYDAMGEASGRPGRYDNFSSSTPASDYLPGFLNTMFPYAIEGDTYDVVYKYYNGSTVNMAETYTYTSGSWTGSFYIDQTEQYLHSGTEFVFDPSVIFTMSSADYQMIVDEVKKTYPDLVDSYGTGEFYYGAGAYYSNFDLGYTSRWSGDYEQAEYVSLSGSERTDLMIQRMAEGIELLLEVKYPDAKPIEGVDVIYTVTSASYDGADGEWLTIFHVIGNAEFELTEGPTKQ